MLRAAARPCIPNRKIKARIGTLPTPTPTRLYRVAGFRCVRVIAHTVTAGNTNKTYQDRSAVYGTICLEGGCGTHTSEGEAVLARPASLPLQGALCGRTFDRHPPPPAPCSPASQPSTWTWTWTLPGLYH